MDTPKSQMVKANPKVCRLRSAHEGRPMHHLYTSRERKRAPNGEWTEWVAICSWCTKEKP